MRLSRAESPFTKSPLAVARTPASTHDADANATRFAGLLAGALAPPLPPAAAADSTAPQSELDTEGAAEIEAKKRDAAAESAATSATGTDSSIAALGAGAAGLNATLQAKLARVITRMKSEFGRDVKVVEGVRSQQRQDQLFEQGRSTSGPIVTWTRNSHHASGRAADLTIDGGYDDAAGFSLLRTVAEQEGLHTLGAKDPGHVELRGGVRAGATTAMDNTGALDLNQLDKAMVEPRQGAIVNAIGVARVASVARVATVARVAGSSGAAAVSGVKVNGAAHTLAAPNGGGAAGKDGTSGGASNSGDSRGEERNGTLRSAPLDGEFNARSGEGAYRALDGTRVAGGASDAPTADARGDAASITAARTARAMDAQDAPGPRTLSRLTLSLDDGQGGQDKVSIGLRGSAIGASFEMRDASSADRVSARLGELTRALEQRGLEPQAFQVRTAHVSRDADIGRAATLATESQRAVADTSAMRQDARADLGGDARHRNAQYDDQQERAQRRQDEQRRRGASFSLTTEES